MQKVINRNNEIVSKTFAIFAQLEKQRFSDFQKDEKEHSRHSGNKTKTRKDEKSNIRFDGIDGNVLSRTD